MLAFASPQKHLPSEPMDEPEETQATQEATQALSQDESQSVRDQRCWAFLQPCSSKMKRIDLEKVKPAYNLGRGQHNDIHFAGFKVSNSHATIRWDGRDDKDSVVTVSDSSSNGTYINGQKIGKGQSRILRDGQEIAFGSIAQSQDPREDYRYIYRQTAGPNVDGIWAHYDMGEELGRGSFATVIKALSRQDGKFYAVKMMQVDRKRHVKGDEMDSQGNVKKPFRREIEIMEQLDHINICKMKEVFIAPNTLNIVLEWVKGGDLLDYIIKSEVGLSEDATRDITYQTCDALRYVHKLGIAHRDLKPENVLLTSDNPPVVKVADFGLAKMVHEETWLKTMCGTPSYLAPEVVEQGETVAGYSHAVDSWSMGVIVFSMLTNTGPFIENENLELKQRIATRTVDWDSLSAKKLSLHCVKFVQTLLDRNPIRRLAMANALDHPFLRSHVVSYLLREPPVASQGSSTSEQTLRGTKRGGTYSRDMSMEDAEVMEVEAPNSAGYPPNHSQSSTSTDGASRIPGAYPKPGTGSPGKGRGQGIVRRAHILAQAAEDGSQLLQPSQEMVHAEERLRDAEVGRTTRSRGVPPVGAGRGSKRKPDDEEDAMMVDGTPQKRRQAGRGRARGTGNTPGSRTRQAAKEDPIEEEVEEKEEEVPTPSLPPPRRSQRKRSTP